MKLDPTSAAQWEAWRQEAERGLEAALAPRADLPAGLLEAMRYAVLGGGKRVRPVLCLATCEAVCGAGALALPAACALELVHAYSLVHDDLPCMDDDDLRRGRPTVHRAFGEGNAVLVGDALQAEAFAVVAGPTWSERVAADARLRVVGELAWAAGCGGMVGGQFLDLEAREVTPGQVELERLHRLKTGALLRASVVCGAVVGGASSAVERALAEFGEAFGALFQLTDDLLDASNPEDAAAASAEEASVNFGLRLGLEALRRAIDAASERAQAALSVLGPRGSFLRQATLAIASRTA